MALTSVNAKVAGYTSIEADAAARRVVESAFDGVLCILLRKSDALVKGWACRFSRANLIVVSAGPPCQGVSGLNASRLGAEQDPQSSLPSHVSRVRELIEKQFKLATTYVLTESVSSMSDADRACMSRGVGILPFELDAACRRARTFWFNWKVQLEAGIEIESPLTSEAEDYGRINFLLDCPPAPCLSPGWVLAGGDSQRLPTFTTSQPKAQPGAALQGT